MAEEIVAQLGYFGIVAALLLGGFGLPIPEEAPILLGAVLAQRGQLVPVWAFGAALVGVILGDFVVYGLGYWHGERVLNLRMTRRWLSPEREQRFQGLFRRHGPKIIVACRFAAGVRTAAYLTAGILRVPPSRMLAIDLFAATLSTSLMFGLGYFAAEWVASSFDQVRRYGLLVLLAIVVVVVLVRVWQSRRRIEPAPPPEPVAAPADAAG